MLDKKNINNSFQKVKNNFDVSMYNIFKQFPDTVQDSVDYFARDIERAATLYVVGLEHKKLKTENFTWHYLENKKNNTNQKKETILFLHGFSDNKYSIAIAARELVKKYNIISIDLPGFGDTDKPWEEKYTLQNYHDWVIEFIIAKGITNFHLMGNSMGGAIAASLAADHPDLFKSITLIGSAGIMGDELVGIYKMIKEGENIFAIENMDDFNKLMQTVFTKPPYIPFILKNYKLRKFLANRKWYEKVLDDLTGGLLNESVTVHNFDRATFLNEKVKNIKKPILLIWGSDDKLNPPALGELYNNLIKDSKLVIIQNTGHIPQIESPVCFVKEFNNFISSLAS